MQPTQRISQPLRRIKKRADKRPAGLLAHFGVIAGRRVRQRAAKSDNPLIADLGIKIDDMLLRIRLKNKRRRRQRAQRAFAVFSALDHLFDMIHKASPFLRLTGCMLLNLQQL